MQYESAFNGRVKQELTMLCKFNHLAEIKETSGKVTQAGFLQSFYLKFCAFSDGNSSWAKKKKRVSFDENHETKQC